MSGSLSHFVYLIDRICEKPGLYLSHISPLAVLDYLNGFCAGLPATERSDYLDEVMKFQRWFERKYAESVHFGGGKSFAHIIMSMKNEQCEVAFDAFRGHWLEYKRFLALRSCGPPIV